MSAPRLLLYLRGAVLVDGQITATCDVVGAGKPLDSANHLAQPIADILSAPLRYRLARREYGSELPELLN